MGFLLGCFNLVLLLLAVVCCYSSFCLFVYLLLLFCVCVCVCACVRECMRACVCVREREGGNMMCDGDGEGE